jgi:hypothetical protein
MANQHKTPLQTSYMHLVSGNTPLSCTSTKPLLVARKSLVFLGISGNTIPRGQMASPSPSHAQSAGVYTLGAAYLAIFKVELPLN